MTSRGMRMVAALVMGAAVVAGCGSTPDVGDTSSSPTPSLAAGEQSAVDSLHGACTEGDVALVAEAGKTLEILQQAGVTDETRLTVLQHLRDSIPAGAPKLDCASQLAAYVQLRAPSAASDG